MSSQHFYRRPPVLDEEASVAAIYVGSPASLERDYEELRQPERQRQKKAGKSL